MTEFSDNNHMRYRDQIKLYSGKEPLKFDARYRAAQLPLVYPESELAVHTDPDGRYTRGRRDVTYSVVLPIDGESLANSSSMRQLIERLKSADLHQKFNWDMEQRRRGVLHATISGTIPFDPEGKVPEELKVALQQIPTFAFQLKGLFMGSFNTGRVYIQVFPETNGNSVLTDKVCDALGCQHNRLLLCGYLNLTEELTGEEAALLSEICTDMQEVVFDTQTCTSIVVMKSYDDLVLRSGVTHRVALANQ